MTFFKRGHWFEWLVNFLLIIAPLGMIVDSWVESSREIPDGWDFVLLFGMLLMLPISLGCLLFYGWQFFRQRPFHLDGYRWLIVAFYVVWLVISVAWWLRFIGH